MTFIPGLVSISFRNLKPKEIIQACRESGLKAIEWGGDVHVPAGQIDAASTVRDATDKAELGMPEYGSYYRIGQSDPAEIEGVVRSAKALDAAVIRVWAYCKNRQDCSAEEYENAVRDAKRICDAFPGMTFCLECHNNTLTEDYHDALRFLEDVDRPSLNMFWQPNQFRTHAYNLEACAALLPYIRAVHVFSWEGTDGKNVMFPLEHHAKRWSEYISILRNAPVGELPMMLEFMHDGRPESLPDTAKTLFDWIG